ncbi:2OG-Fe(II) oxygenase [Prochlorococcus sp. MIT 1300]|uniref:2OG-Fe(II) oxygenase n=1 Tax=Prochlorococcus sp. MIT 1300 TaxID=3096218 RepID=UPI002A74E4B3|nr:2OG-Fe(II) oxygenase [Prochlorococcus sp. MIT 1300]
MNLIACYRNPGLDSVADGVISFFDRRPDLHRSGVVFGNDSSLVEAKPAKVSTDISLVAIDRSDPEAFALADVIVRGVTSALNKYLKDRPLFRECSPEQSMFVMPIFNIQHYGHGEGFKRWHCDWTISDEATEPVNRVLAWILYCNDIDSAGTEFYWQEHHESAERGKLVIFPAGPSHIHRGRVNDQGTKTIATGWINAGSRDAYLSRLAAS